MGFFDFFRRKRPTPPAPREIVDDTVEDEPPLRCEHYTLAHIALRTVAHNDPLAFLGALASPAATSFLAEMVQSVRKHCGERTRDEVSGAEYELPVDDLTVHKVRAGRCPCAVIEMPVPRAIAEAHFVAAVLLTDWHPPEPVPDVVDMRYFTLERGTRIDGSPRTVLCEWSAEGTHINYGDGPEANVEAFTRAIENLLAAAPGRGVG